MRSWRGRERLFFGPASEHASWTSWASVSKGRVVSVVYKTPTTGGHDSDTSYICVKLPKNEISTTLWDLNSSGWFDPCLSLSFSRSEVRRLGRPEFPEQEDVYHQQLLLFAIYCV